MWPQTPAQIEHIHSLSTLNAWSRPIKIAYVTTGAFPDPAAWSGTNQHIHDALLSAGAELVPIHSLKKHRSVMQKIKKSTYQMRGKRYLPTRDPQVLHHYADQVARQLEVTAHDIVFSPGSIPVAYLECRAPIVCYTDATYAGVVDYYEHYSNLCQETLDDGHAMESRMLDKASLAIYSSEWAAQTARGHYQANPEKVKVVPFGANLTDSPSPTEITASIQARTFDRCELLFVGVDWHRKGGALAVSVVEALNARGCPAHLHVVGCQPSQPLPDCVTVHGFLDKQNPSQSQQLIQLYLRSHFFILPSQAECFGVVFAEASAYGLPSLAVRTGGVPTAINTGKTGWTLPPDATVDDWCEAILPVITQPDTYRAMAAHSRKDYEQRLNWNVAGGSLYALLESLV